MTQIVIPTEVEGSAVLFCHLKWKESTPLRHPERLALRREGSLYFAPECIKRIEL